MLKLKCLGSHLNDLIIYSEYFQPLQWEIAFTVHLLRFVLYPDAVHT